MIKRIIPVLLCLLLIRCSDTDIKKDTPKPIDENSKGIAARWADVTLHVIRNSFPNSPTYTSRSLGYMGVTMYESIVHGYTGHQSLAGQLNELETLPLPDDSEYNWTIALNAGQAYMLRKLYPHTFVMDSINSFENNAFNDLLSTTTEEIANRSKLYGEAVAEAIYNWSITDGGYEGYLHHFDPEYEFPSGAGFWTPPFFGQSSSPYPLHPYWGNNRTFIPANSNLEVPVKVAYSKNKGSEYYQYFLEVYQKRSRLSAEDKRIAAWWADDPTQSSSPPGHSYNIATIVITTAQADLFTAAETYAKVGMAVADAFINCWKCKYTYHSERPYPYIKANIKDSYTQFWPEPPFPAFSSGHATQSAATAIALMSVYNNQTPILDNTHANRHPDFENIEYKARPFQTIWETAEECAYSRFLGGIHTRMDNEAGTDQGKIIGENVNALQWEN